MKYGPLTILRPGPQPAGARTLLTRRSGDRQDRQADLDREATRRGSTSRRGLPPLDDGTALLWLGRDATAGARDSATARPDGRRCGISVPADENVARRDRHCESLQTSRWRRRHVQRRRSRSHRTRRSSRSADRPIARRISTPVRASGRRSTTEPGIHTGDRSATIRALASSSPPRRSTPMPRRRCSTRTRRRTDRRTPLRRHRAAVQAERQGREGRRLLDRDRPPAELRPEEEVPRHRGRLRRAEAPARRPGDAELARAAVARRPGVHRRRHRQPRHAGPRPRLGTRRSTRSSAPCRSRIR